MKEYLPQAIEESVNEALSMVALNPEKVDYDFSNNTNDSICSTIYIKGAMVGKMSVFIKNDDASKIVGKMLGSEGEINPFEVQDGIGEILNMVVGGVKSKCDSKGLKFDISVPSTISTKDQPGGKEVKDIEIREHFKAEDSVFQVLLSCKEVITQKEEVEEEEKPKLSAADMLAQLIQKNTEG